MLALRAIRTPRLPARPPGSLKRVLPAYVRAYADQSNPPEEGDAPQPKDAAAASGTPPMMPKSSCQANTVLVGLNYLKDQPPLIALPDEEYPDWLWGILEPMNLPDDGPGGEKERRRRRQENRQRIKDQNFMKTQ